MKKKTKILLSLVLLGICFLGINLAQTERNDQEDTEEATPVQIGVMTDRQREHGKLFRNFGIGRKITELLKENADRLKQNEELSIVRGAPSEGDVPGTTFSLNDFVATATCNADAVVIGAVVDKASQLTENGEFLFTDYTINVDTVLKDATSFLNESSDSIIVTRAGGKVKIGNQVVRAVDKSAHPLKKGRKYLLFLERVPNTGTFITVDVTSAFSASGNQVRKLSDSRWGRHLDGMESSEIIDVIRASAVHECGGRP